MQLSPVAASAPAASSGAAAPSSRGMISSDFQTFLKMLTTQIRNQDPLSPMPSSDFAVQLATFSSVEQQVRTNELLAQLGAQFGAMGMAQFAGWVGMEARSVAPAYFGGSPIVLSPNPPQIADRVELVVRDAAGREVERREIPLTTEEYVWTGTSPTGAPYLHGPYSFELVSFSQGMPVASTPVESYSRIVEARGEGGATVLVFEGGARIAASEVTGLRRPAG